MFTQKYVPFFSNSTDHVGTATEREIKVKNDKIFSSFEEEFPKKLEDAGFNTYVYESVGYGLSHVIQYKKYPNVWAKVNFNRYEQSEVVAFQYYVNHNKWSMFEITLDDLIMMTKLNNDLFRKEMFENLAEHAIKMIQPNLPPEYMFHYESDEVIKDFGIDFFLNYGVKTDYELCHIEYGGGTEDDGEFNFGHIVKDHIRFDETQFKLVQMFVYEKRHYPFKTNKEEI